MHTRPLVQADIPAARSVVGARPYANCFLSAMLERGSVGELVGAFEDEDLMALVSVGANCVPTELDVESARALAQHLAVAGRRSASIVGRRDDVTLLWRALDGRWGPPRDTRAAQPLMVLQGEPSLEPDPLVRRGEPADFDLLFPRCVEMFTAEVGISPLSRGMEGAYRARVRDAIAAGRSFLRIDDGVVLFKTEIGAISAAACQLQGVWVNPELRGRGLSAPALAAVATIAMRETAPAVELYVNDFNTVARRAYERVGFEYVDTFSTVFF